jgi:hypothetical protein
MTRQLLTLLAILTGLAAVNAPAHAANAGAMACAVETAQNAADERDIHAQISEKTGKSRAPTALHENARFCANFALFCANSVLIGSDRARE